MNKPLLALAMGVALSAGLTASAVPTPAEGFALRTWIDFDNVKSNETILTMGPARLTVRLAGTDSGLASYDQRSGNYLNFKRPDGSCPIIEATISDHAGRVGIPLAALPSAKGVHEVMLSYLSPRLSILVDGCKDVDYPSPAYPITWQSNFLPETRSARVKKWQLAVPDVRLGEQRDVRPIKRSIQYWTPEGHNTWVGDVAPGFINGKLHVFYLLDRRHHGSGEGTGRHQFAHLVSDDLVNWSELPLAVPIREWWQTVGTGTPFSFGGKLAIAFGWHTSRYGDMAKDKPIGGSFAYSEDGIHFRNSGEIISDAQNPSIYNRADGLYELVTSYGGSIGIFRSKDLKDWKLFDAKLPFRGDCPSLFDWHGRRYLLQGFTNMAYSPDGQPGTFVNWTQEPDVLYEGLSVPMVTNWKNDRRLYIGWLSHPYGWGGWLVFREVVYYPDGRLGLKWVPEIEPPVPSRDYRAAAGERFRLRYPSKSGGPAVRLTVDPAKGEATWMDDAPNASVGAATSAYNIRIGKVRGLDADYAVRAIAYYDAKANITIFDAEIAGQRTVICRRDGKFGEPEVEK